MPARGRRSAKPFTRRRSAAAFRLRPPVPRMNLSPNRGREDGAAVRPGPPGVVRLRPLLAGRQVLPGYGYGCPFRRSVAHPAFRSPFRRHGLPTPFRRRPFIGGLLSAAFCRRPFSAARPLGTVPLFCARRNSPDQLLLVSVSSPLRPLSAPTPLRSAPSPSRPVPVPVPVPFLSPLRSVPILSPPSSPPSFPSSFPSPFPSRSCPRPFFWRGAASSLFFGPRVEKPEKLFRFVISK